ncbi:hypothetical protein, partial [Pseudomonas savastanoi]
QRLPKRYLDSLLYKPAIDFPIEFITKHKIPELENPSELYKNAKTMFTGLNIITFFVLCGMFVISSLFFIHGWLFNSHTKPNGEVIEDAMPTFFIFISAIVYMPFINDYSISLAIIGISAIMGVVYLLISMTSIYMTTNISTSIYSNNYEKSLSSALVESSDSLIENAIDNYLDIEAAKINRKNLNIEFNIVKGLNGRPTIESVQNTLDCYSKTNVNVNYNNMLLSADTMQNNRCYGEWTKLSSMQSFGFVESSEKDIVKQEIARMLIGFESEIAALQEEVRRNQCVNTFDSANPETKDTNCLDYRNNQAVNDGGYAAFISESISNEELISKKKVLVQKIRMAISELAKKEEEKSLDDYMNRNIMFAKNMILLAPFLTYVNSIYQNIGYSDYLDYFKKAVVVFKGYEISGTKTQLHLLGETSMAKLTIPVEIEAFNLLSKTSIFKQTDYFKLMLVKNNKECLDSFNACDTLKISNFGEFEKNAKESVSYLSKIFFVMSAFEGKSNNNQALSFATMLVKYSLIGSLIMILATFIVPFYHHSKKLLYFFVLILYSIIQLIFVIPFSAALKWCFGGEYDIMHEVKQLVFNTAIEPIVYLSSYVIYINLCFTFLAIFSIDFTASSSTISSIFSFDISAWLNTIMSFALMIYVFGKAHSKCEEITENVCTLFEVAKYKDIESELYAYSDKAASKAKKILLK